MIFNPKGFRALEVSISKKNKTKHFCQSVSFMKKMFLNEKKYLFNSAAVCATRSKQTYLWLFRISLYIWDHSYIV